ncbi:MAG: hypothetical protein KAW41_00360 [Candidatus Diapherotrites archaeon]|nr:hypothetical protein [Candidatus Diapherotrites archaeon]
MRKGQANIVGYVMLLAIGAILGVALFYMFASTSSEIGTIMHTQSRQQARVISSSLSLYAPGAVREGIPYRAVVQNTGHSTITGLSAFIKSGEVETSLTVTDLGGSPISSLLKDRVGLVTVAPPPQQGDLLVVGGKETYAFKSFDTAPKRVKQVVCGGPELSAVDGSGITIYSNTCGANNTFTCNLTVDPDSLYVVAWAKSQGGYSYFIVTDGGNFSVLDSVSSDGDEGVYYAGDAATPGNELDVCIQKTVGGYLFLDYLIAVPLYTPEV